MPELIQDGPDIPVELMNRQNDGKVVFFCGSGISVSTGLPIFDGLVSQIYKRTDETPNELEESLCKKGQLDKVLGLLEERLNPGRLRREAVNILCAPPEENSLETHDALLNLSRHAGHGIRLVTTNFDDRFELADQNIAIDAAPKLPFPKPHGWGSVVHLHGRIMSANDDGQNLVLTAADFGRAYLTERWASRFITELFREFTIVFVGYSLNDPVMSYIVDALAAERSRGARFQEAYAFADFKGGTEGRKKVELDWQGKNVSPILFDVQDGFGTLTRTLVKWAEISRDPIKLRRQIVFDELRKLPANAKDPVAQRVIWALSDKPTAEALAKTPASTDEDYYPILAGWLDVFDESGLLSRPGEALDDGRPRLTPIVGDAYTQFANNPLDGISRQFALWLAKHLHVPQVLGWAARKGGNLHPFFRDEVRRRLSIGSDGGRKLLEIPERLRLLWTILTQNSPVHHNEGLWWVYHIGNAASDIEQALVECALIASLRPHLAVLPGPPSHVHFRKLFGDDSTPLTPLEECAHIKLTAGEEWRETGFERASFKDDFLANHAFTITEHLRHAAQLLPQDEDGPKISHHYRPAIEDHEQNRNRDDWTFLIDWVRDGYFALSKKNPSLANLLVRLWIEHEIPLFDRLALHAITDDSNADIHSAAKLLLSGTPVNVWSFELYHEVMVFLRNAGQRLSAEDLSKLIEIIKIGPPYAIKNEDDENFRKRAICLRLSKLASSGAKLDTEAQQIASTYRPLQDESPDRDEFLTWVGAPRWVEPQDHIRANWRKAPPINQLVDQAQQQQIDEEEFEGICITSLSRALHTLRKLSESENWPAMYWRRLLRSMNNPRHGEKPCPRYLRDAANLLLDAPNNLHAEIALESSQLIENLSRLWPIDHENTLRELWSKAWGAVDDASNIDTDDVLTQALNSTAGRLAEAAFNRLWKYQPEAEKGLPEPVSGYFEAIATSDSGRMGRVILAVKLSNLFAIAPDWTSQLFLPHMRWESDEARDLWAAYAWAARAGPNLLAAIKDDFIEALGQYADLGEQRSNLVHLFLAASLDTQTIITSDDIRRVMANLPEDGLIDIAEFFENRLGEGEAEQANIWNNDCLPWLSEYWPKARKRSTPKTSTALVKCLIKTGNSFPTALEWASEFLRNGINHVLWDIKESKIHKIWPSEALRMLGIMISDNTLEAFNKHMLQEILEEIKDAKEDISRDQIFQRLSQL